MAGTMERKTSTNFISFQLCYPCYSLEELLLMRGIWFSHCDMRMNTSSSMLGSPATHKVLEAPLLGSHILSTCGSQILPQ